MLMRILLLLSISAVYSCAVAAPILVDPTQPYTSRVAPVARISGGTPILKLQAILMSPDRRLAIINDQLVQEGTQLAGASITRISATTVRYTWRGQSHELSLISATPLRITRLQETKP